MGVQGREIHEPSNQGREIHEPPNEGREIHEPPNEGQSTEIGIHVHISYFGQREVHALPIGVENRSFICLMSNVIYL